MFQKLGNSVRRFMIGRNGVDALAWASCILGIVLNLMSSITKHPVFMTLAYLPLMYAIFRIFSRNIPRRYAENQKFMQLVARIKGRKNYCYFKCPGCKTKVRVPRGKGKIRISCPNCRESFIKKT